MESTVYVTESAGKNVRAHILRVDHDANVSFKVSTKTYFKKNSTKKTRKKYAKNWTKKKWGYATVYKQAKSYESAKDKEGQVIAAANGDFYNDGKKNGTTYGTLIMEGNKINKKKSVMFTVDNDGVPAILPKGSSTSNIQEAVGGLYYILKDGKVKEDIPKNDEFKTIMAIGVTKNKDVVIAVVDGREPSSQGTTLHDMGIILKQQGCKDAMNLDCGGSASFLTKRDSGKLTFRNTPNDGIARPVSSSILVVEKETEPEMTPPDEPAADMTDTDTELSQTEEGVYRYKVDGEYQTGFRIINNENYLFDQDGNGATETVVIGNDEYHYEKGLLESCSDEKAGRIAIGYCGDSDTSEGVLYAYNYGDKKLNIGPDPYAESWQMKQWTNITMVPWQTEKYRVKSVVVGKGVRTLGGFFIYIPANPFNTALKKKKPVLKKVSLPSSLKRIGKAAFSNQRALKTITVPKKVTRIGDRAFYGLNGAKITFKSKTPPKFGKSVFAKGTAKKRIKLRVPKTAKWKKFLRKNKNKKKLGLKGCRIIYY